MPLMIANKLSSKIGLSEFEPGAAFFLSSPARKRYRSPKAVKKIAGISVKARPAVTQIGGAASKLNEEVKAFVELCNCFNKKYRKKIVPARSPIFTNLTVGKER